MTRSEVWRSSDNVALWVYIQGSRGTLCRSSLYLSFHYCGIQLCPLHYLILSSQPDLMKVFLWVTGTLKNLWENCLTVIHVAMMRNFSLLLFFCQETERLTKRWPTTSADLIHFPVESFVTLAFSINYTDGGCPAQSHNIKAFVTASAKHLSAKLHFCSRNH